MSDTPKSGTELMRESGPTLGEVIERLANENAALRERIAELEAALRSYAESAMQAHGASFEDLHICGNCNGTGYTA